MSVRGNLTLRSAAEVTPVTFEAQSSAVVRRAVVAVGLVTIAVIHLLDLPGKWEEVRYLGWGYIGVIVTSLVLADLVLRRDDRRVTGAAGLVSASVLIGFMINRTVGMPGAIGAIGNWGEPLGVAALVAEAVVLWVAAHSALARSHS